MKLDEIFEGSNPKVKAYIITIPRECKDLLKKSDQVKEDMIFGEEEGDDSFIQNQTVVTVEYIDVKGDKVYVYPFMIKHEYDSKLQKELQNDFEDWCFDHSFDSDE